MENFLAFFDHNFVIKLHLHRWICDPAAVQKHTALLHQPPCLPVGGSEPAFDQQRQKAYGFVL